MEYARRSVTIARVESASQRPGRGRHARLSIGMGAAVAVTLASCAFVDAFAAYRGVDLVASAQLADWTPDDPTYLRYELVAESPPVASAGVYRLELRNLIANGDFDTDAIGPWASNSRGGLADMVDVVFGGTGEPIDGNTMRMITDDAADVVEFDLSSALDGFVGGAAYTVKFDYRTAPSTLVFEYRDDVQCQLAGAMCRTWRAGGGDDGTNFLDDAWFIDP